MTISILIGKPGSGKSYHATRKIASVLCAWSRKSQAGVIVTNLSLRLDNLDAFVERHTGVKNFVKDHVQLVDDDYLRFDPSKLRPTDVTQETRGSKIFEVVNPYSPAYFWNRLPDGAFIVIDEIQKYVGSIKEYGESENQSLTNYFTQHRHHRHEWIIITQSMDSVNSTIKECAQTVYEVFNAKNTYLGFPISIPLRDVDVLLKGFGIERQVYRVREGSLDPSYKIGWEAGVQVVTMSQEIFSLYATHTLLKREPKPGADVAASLVEHTDSDLPFDLGRGSAWRATKWFVKKHAWHLILKSCLLVLLLLGIYAFFNFLKRPWHWFGDHTPAVASDDGSSLAEAPLVPLEISNKEQIAEEEQKEEEPKEKEKKEEYNYDDDWEVSFDDNEVDEKILVVRPSSIISGEFIGPNNRTYRVGDVLNGERITSIDPRDGVKNEPIEIEIDRILRQSELYRLFYLERLKGRRDSE